MVPGQPRQKVYEIPSQQKNSGGTHLSFQPMPAGAKTKTLCPKQPEQKGLEVFLKP
jgi:hypothetical protein